MILVILKILLKKEENIFKNEHYYNALSLISVMLIDLGIIEKK